MGFEIERLELDGVAVIRCKRFVDLRGYFSETWSQRAFAEFGLDRDFVQDNESGSTSAGTVRGLHFQRAPFEQAKLVRVLAGSVFDVVVDIRPHSPTFGQWCSVTLTAARGEQLYVPRGFAHGFATLEPNAIVSYKVDAPYSPAHEGGILWNDSRLGIQWPVGPDKAILSDKDRVLPSFDVVMSPARDLAVAG